MQSLKIYNSLIQYYVFRTNSFGYKKCQSPLAISPHAYAIKLATVRISPNLRLLSFRVSKNYLYFSFASPDTDLMEFNQLCQDNESV
ncbi:hypothetical protein O3G_MSEX002073 [Manduca sexta]|uniref:Uncharacterized protein n=1 Tax=Manduca sexta TaxID=7130 RepID=A0A921YMN3_MANSE|nr:hypothetical protein O3G_MSEX002073 [Manduca sexta]KAG6441881.1 hypothetical protein O3G_MSEX002073 [Manduca sexta]